MRLQTKHAWLLLAGAVGVAVFSPGCGGDDSTSPRTSTSSSSGSTGTGQGGGGGTGQGGAGGGTTTTTTTTSTGTSGGGGGAGGGAAENHGPPATETVSAGETSKSASYRMVFTFGQPAQNQGKTTSSSYRMQGGLVGANGSLP